MISHCSFFSTMHQNPTPAMAAQSPPPAWNMYAFSYDRSEATPAMLWLAEQGTTRVVYFQSRRCGSGWHGSWGLVTEAGQTQPLAISATFNARGPDWPGISLNCVAVARGIYDGFDGRGRHVRLTLRAMYRT